MDDIAMVGVPNSTFFMTSDNQDFQIQNDFSSHHIHIHPVYLENLAEYEFCNEYLTINFEKETCEPCGAYHGDKSYSCDSILNSNDFPNAL